MTTREEALAYGLSFPDTYQEAPFHDENWQLVRVKGCKKVFLWTYERNGYINLNVKVSPEWRDLWRSTYSSVIAGWHQNKEHWNTIILDGTVPDEDIRRMIAESYDLVSDSPTKRIYEAVKKIPRGQVATYGQIAELAGDKKVQIQVEMVAVPSSISVCALPSHTSVPCDNPAIRMRSENSFGFVSRSMPMAKSVPNSGIPKAPSGHPSISSGSMPKAEVF